MPQITLNFSDAASIPDALKPFAGSGTSVVIWAGDRVADETNAGLAANRDAIKTEKDGLQTKYDDLVKTTGETSRQLSEAQVKLASGTSATPEDLAIVSAVKKHLPTIKAADLDKKLETIPALETKVQTFESRDSNAKLFKASGFKNETVFLDLLGSKDKNPNLIECVVETEKVDGKDVEKPFAKVKQADGTTAKLALSDYVKGQDGWKEYLPILNGTSVVSQHEWLIQPPSGVGNDDFKIGGFDVDAYVNLKNKAAEAAPNPLNPKASAPTGQQATVPQN